jgi:hypothetical protein
MRSLILGVMSLALISCSERQTTHDATMAIAEDVSKDAIAPLKDKVTNLEERLASLEVELRAEEKYSKAVHSALDEERENRAKDVNALRDHYNDHLSRFHGAP